MIDYREDKRDFEARWQAEQSRIIAALNAIPEDAPDLDKAYGALYAERDAFNQFMAALARVREDNGWSRMAGWKNQPAKPSFTYRVLDVPPYRGIFLVSLASETAVGLLFQKRPFDRDILGRLAALGDHWIGKLAEEEPS